MYNNLLQPIPKNNKLRYKTTKEYIQREKREEKRREKILISDCMSLVYADSAIMQ